MTMPIPEAFARIGEIMLAAFPPPPDTGYAGNRCGWYPAKPKRTRKAARR